MKSGGPWKFRGLRSPARAAAGDSAPRPSKSVGEWLNAAIQRSEAEEDLTDDTRLAQRLGTASGHGRDDRGPEAQPEPGSPYRDEQRSNLTQREALQTIIEDDNGRTLPGVEVAGDAPPRGLPQNRAGSGDIHARLDQLTQQLDRLAHIQAARQRKPEPPARNPEGRERPPPDVPARQQRRTKPEPVPSIEDAVAEITARQRVLDGISAAEASPGPPARANAISSAAFDEAAVTALGGGPFAPADHNKNTPSPLPVPLPAAVPTVDFSSLENHLREITARIEALQPSTGIEQAITALRHDLADIGRQLNDALPQRALQSLEIEVKALGERIEHSRQAGVDPNALAGLDRGLVDIREALRVLTPAENLTGFNEAVSALSQKVDLILARHDPSALQQLESAIAGLRGVVSHVASNDTLSRVADDVRALAAQVDGIANKAATGDAVSMLEQHIGVLADRLGGGVSIPATEHAVSALEQRIGALLGQIESITSTAANSPVISGIERRIDNLTAALTASSEAGHAVPRDLEKLLSGLIEKLEWVQLTHTDHAALAHLEDRIAGLVQRFDASDARLGHLEAIERGLADLLVHLEQIRGMIGAGVAGAAASAPAAVEREVAEIRRSERRIQDSLEAVHGTVEHVVDRLATIESGMHRDAVSDSNPATQKQPASEPPADEPRGGEPGGPPGAGSTEPSGTSEPGDAPAPRAPLARLPIDPTLPPNHPLEPGSTGGRSRPTLSAAERISASEAAIGSTKPPVISDSERPDFIAAARRAAQAAAWEPSSQKTKAGLGTEQSPAQPNKLSQRLRKLIMAGGAVLILVGCLRIATKLLDDHGQGTPPRLQSQETQLSAASPGAAESAPPPVVGPPLSLPSAPVARPIQPPAAERTAEPGRQSMMHDRQDRPVVATAQPTPRTGAPAMPLWATPDITGALPSSVMAPSMASPADRPAAAAADKGLPATIGDSALRKAALAGDPAAAYEIGNRFAEGRGVLQDNEQAAYWLQRAASQGLAPAEFRLGGLYEKGLGVNKDLGKARDLYLAAAEKGNGKAMHNLAVLYAEGVDGPPDYDKAAAWFGKAADHGIRDSQYNLGILYARGIGVQQNDAESYKWFALAAKQGDADAAKKRDQIASRLTPKALAAVRLAVQTWAPQPQPDDAINVKMAAAWSPTAQTSHAAKPQ